MRSASVIRSILIFELGCAVFMVVVGSALHFLFELVGGGFVRVGRKLCQ